MFNIRPFLTSEELDDLHPQELIEYLREVCQLRNDLSLELEHAKLNIRKITKNINARLEILREERFEAMLESELDYNQHKHSIH